MGSEYDDMAFEDDGALAPEGAMGEEKPEGEEDVDAEFAMHAVKAGFDSPDKQKALWAAIQRCNAMATEEEPEEEMAEGEMGGEDSLAGLDAFSEMG